MAEIRCPHCGEMFQVDETEYAQIVRQVRDAEFRRELEARERSAERERKSAVEAAVARIRQETLVATAQKDAEIARLEAELKARESSFDAEKALAVSEATGEQGQRIVELQGDLRAARLEREQVEASLRQQMAEQAQFKDQTIRDREDEIERLRNQRARLSTKLIGETLEQHCETEFNRWRATAFRGAEFHKDNEVVGGSKGDYVFREVDDEGVEVVSIMFEMKNEDDASAASSRHKNADFFKKLDQDRRNKGCEYAVLVSLLEPESELYNAGIVDVS